MNIKSISVHLAFIAGTLFSVVSIAQPPKQETTTNEAVCDPLIGQAPGLYGLCVAFCEAQNCEATYDPESGEISLDEKCEPSSLKLLKSFNELAGDGGLGMPCVNPKETECPCWTEAELDYIADGGASGCYSHFMTGYDGSSYKIDFVSISSTSSGGTCYYVENTPSKITRYQAITDEQFNACKKSLENDCLSRGF